MKRFCRNLTVTVKIIIHSNKWLGRWKNTSYLEEEQKIESTSQKKSGLEWSKLTKKEDPSQPREELWKRKEPGSTPYSWRLKGLIQFLEINRICIFLDLLSTYKKKRESEAFACLTILYSLHWGFLSLSWFREVSQGIYTEPTVTLTRLNSHLMLWRSCDARCLEV